MISVSQLRLARKDRHENHLMTHCFGRVVGLASLKLIGGKTREEFLFKILWPRFSVSRSVVHRGTEMAGVSWDGEDW